MKTLSNKNTYFISKERYLELKHFCLQYDEWQNTQIKIHTASIIEVKQQKDFSSPTETDAINMIEARNNSLLIEKTAYATDHILAPYILLAVTKGKSYENIRTTIGIPCCRNAFYKLYRKFFFLLDRARRLP